MNLQGVGCGDIVECRRRDRRFHALVTERRDSQLKFVPLAHNCSFYFASAREVLAHWALRPGSDGRPRTRSIRAGDVVAFGPPGSMTYAEVVSREGRTLRVAELRTGSPARPLAMTDVTAHFARRGRRRPQR